MGEAAVLESPRVRNLREALAAGQDEALAGFWTELRREGAPLVEPVEGNEHEFLVTFVWRGDSATDHVLLNGGFTRGNIWDNALARLLDTDLWYRTYRLAGDLRTGYEFSPNNPLRSWDEIDGWEAWSRHMVEYWLPDPFNPKTFCFPPDEERPGPVFERPRSYIELPAAPPQPYVHTRPDVPHGKVALTRFHSALLDNDRRVWVYTPPGYRSDAAPYPLVLLFDGWAVIHSAPATFDNLLAEGRMPAVVAVLVDFANNDRDKELCCYPPFADLVAQELVPWAREHYHIAADPAQSLVGGVSLGGLAATYTAWRHPEVFGNVLSQSGSYWWAPQGEVQEWLARQVATSEKRALRFYLDAGRLEDKPDTAYDPNPTQVTVNRHMRDVLQAKGHEVHYAEYPGGHEFLAIQGTLADGLMALLGPARTG
jgi:enterochelin esterase-like enzyme